LSFTGGGEGALRRVRRRGGDGGARGTSNHSEEARRRRNAAVEQAAAVASGGEDVSIIEPPKLYGPHAPVIVPKTSDGYACTPDNLRRSVGCSHKTPIQLHLTTHTRINKGVTTILEHLYKTLHRNAEE
jgi:hypothetical protein